MPGVALEPDFILDFPETPRDYEAAPIKRRLIEPVTAANEAMKRKPRRDTAQKLARLPSDDIPVTTTDDLPIHPIILWLMKLERIFCKLVLG